MPASDSPRSLHGARRIDELGERILFEVRALRFDEFSLAIVDSERKTLDLRVQERGGEHLPSQRLALDHGPFGWVATRGASSSRTGHRRRNPCASPPQPQASPKGR